MQKTFMQLWRSVCTRKVRNAADSYANMKNVVFPENQEEEKALDSFMKRNIDRGKRDEGLAVDDLYMNFYRLMAVLEFLNWRLDRAIEDNGPYMVEDKNAILFGDPSHLMNDYRGEDGRHQSSYTRLLDADCFHIHTMVNAAVQCI